MGPLLFILYINDVDDHLTCANIIKYADHTVIFLAGKDVTRIEDQLTKKMQHIDNWLEENDLIINLDKGKTESMLLGSSRKILNKCLKIYINDRLINFTTKYKYLGVVVDQTLSLGEHFCLVVQDRGTKIIKSSITDAYLSLPNIMNFAHFQTCLLVRQCVDKNICSNFLNYFEPLHHGKNTHNN